MRRSVSGYISHSATGQPVALHTRGLLWVQKPALPRRSIGVRFALNKQTLTERVQCDAMCQKLTNAVQQIWGISAHKKY